jgi:hypothetical protein
MNSTTYLPNPARPHGNPTFPSRPRRWRRVVLAGLAASAAAVATAGPVDAHGSGASGRPNVTITATPDGLALPAEVPGGLVDITLETEPGSSDGVGHHLVIARLHDGVTLDEFLAAGDAAAFTMIEFKGGNGTIAAGESLDMTLDLDPGDYFVLDNPQLPDPVIEPFTVVEPQEYGPEPVAEGTVRIGPNMVIALPEHFDGTGVWEFVNDDPAMVHEAAMVRLAQGTSIDDVIAWGQGGFAGEIPFDGEFGSMGALGPGERAWMTLVAPGPGDYALLCFVPDETGRPHLGAGMVVPFTIEG